jgi:hypothetical protein
MPAIKVPTAKLRSFAKKNVPNPLFVVLSGSHAYGFPSPDSDYDLRGAHIAKTKDLLGLRKPPETMERKGEGVELVTHEAEKFLGLLLSPSGYVLEQIFSPYTILETKEFKQLKLLSKNVLCKKLHAHYAGFGLSVYKKAKAAEWRDVKENIYLLRILMTGILLLEKGKIVVDIQELNKIFKIDVLPQLVEFKKKGERVHDHFNLEKEATELFQRLDQAYKSSNLPPDIRHWDKFDDWLMKLRMRNL